MNPWAVKTPDTAKPVIVTWRDIRDISNWDDDGDVRCARRLQSMGWLIYDGPDPVEPEYDILVIATTYDHEEGKWADLTVFPKTVLKSVKGPWQSAIES